jgi:hypothetical protein
MGEGDDFAGDFARFDHHEIRAAWFAGGCAVLAGQEVALGETRNWAGLKIFVVREADPLRFLAGAKQDIELVRLGNVALGVAFEHRLHRDSPRVRQQLEGE